MTAQPVLRSAEPSGPASDAVPLRALPDALPTDAELIARSVDDPEQFATRFDRHATAVHRSLGRRVGELADDLLSETAPAQGGWVLQARFPDGTVFRVEAPGTLTREEVLAIADQVTWTP